MSNKWIVAALGICLATSLLNLGILVHQLANPSRPVNVKGMTAKDWVSDKQFKKAVESIAEDIVSSNGYLDEDEVKELINRCVATRGRIEC